MHRVQAGGILIELRGCARTIAQGWPKSWAKFRYNYDTDFQSKQWAKSRHSAQPCEAHLLGSGDVHAFREGECVQADEMRLTAGWVPAHGAALREPSQ